MGRKKGRAVGPTEALDAVELLASVFQDCFSLRVSIEEPCLVKSRNRKYAGQNRRNQGDVGRRSPRSGPGRWVRGGATEVELYRTDVRGRGLWGGTKG